MSYKVETTNQGRFAVVGSDGRTEHVFHCEGAAITACDALNRASYEPVVSPYLFAEGGCGRWDRIQRRKAA